MSRIVKVEKGFAYTGAVQRVYIMKRGFNSREAYEKYRQTGKPPQPGSIRVYPPKEIKKTDKLPFRIWPPAYLIENTRRAWGPGRYTLIRGAGKGDWKKIIYIVD